MDAQQFVESARASGDALAAAAEGNLDREVPACSGWTVTDLVGHVAGVCEFWTGIVRGTAPGDVQFTKEVAEGDEIGHLRRCLDGLLAAIEGVDPATPCWTWAPSSQHVGFVQRRIANELAIHRWDAEQAAGDPTPVPTEMAIDGIDEFLHLFLGRRPAPGAQEVSGSVHLHPTDGDGDGEWEIVPAPEGSDTMFEVEAGHAKSDTAMRATASDLLLALWRRTDDAVEVLGDAEVARRFLAASAL